MRARAWTPAPGPIGTLHPILEQIAAAAVGTGFDPPVFGAAKALFDKAMAEGWADLDIAAVHDIVVGEHSREGQSA
jgi:3-hydroxyisobutyrate dehydrogenase